MMYRRDVKNRCIDEYVESKAKTVAKSPKRARNAIAGNVVPSALPVGAAISMAPK